MLRQQLCIWDNKMNFANWQSRHYFYLCHVKQQFMEIKYYKINSCVVLFQPGVVDRLAHGMLHARHNYQRILLKYVSTLRDIHTLKKVSLMCFTGWFEMWKRQTITKQCVVNITYLLVSKKWISYFQVLNNFVCYCRN